jgi:hypothetical protein
LLLANAILAGQTNNFNRGADDQIGIESAKAFPNPAGTVHFLASRGDYWIGPLPGVNHWRLFLTRHLAGVSPASPQGFVLLTQGLAAVANRAAPVWPADLPICTVTDAAPPTGRSDLANFMLGMGAVGGLVGLGWLTLRVAKNLAMSGTFLGANRKGLIHERRR